MVLAIGAGMDQGTCQSWIDTYGLTHPVLADPTGAIYNLFGNGYVPYNAVIDGEMILRYTASGYNQPAIIATIEQYKPLWIDHVPLRDTENDVNPYSTDCAITSAYAPIADDLMLHWNLDGGSSFNDVTLTPLGGDDYTAEIPAQVYGTTVYYYLSAADTGGRTRTHPADAPTGLHSFYVGVDTIPPMVEHVPLGDQVDVTWPPTVRATVTDNLDLPVDSVTLEFMINGGPVESVPMLPDRDGLYSADFTGSVSVGDTVEYRIIAVDSAASPNTTTDPVTGYHVFYIIEQIPVLIFEPDGTPLSGGFIAQGLDALGISYEMEAALPENCSRYRTIFACLGIYPNNRVLTADQGQALADFLDNGGQLYMEGGDTWFYDPATAVHPYFNINGLSDGTGPAGDAGPIEGAVGTFAEGMYFTYQGENSYIDRLGLLGSAFSVFLNVSPTYINGIAYDGGSYRTVGTSFEFGGLVDGSSPSTKDRLLIEILDFFGLNASGVFEDGFESGDTSAWSTTGP
jgi:hypothetical protein